MGNELGQLPDGGSDQAEINVNTAQPSPNISRTRPVIRASSSTGSPSRMLSDLDQRSTSSTPIEQCTTDWPLPGESHRRKPCTTEAIRQTGEMVLTDEEREHINQVLSRVRQLEQREDARISKLLGEVKQSEQEIRRRVSISNQDVTMHNRVCVLCGRLGDATTDRDSHEHSGEQVWHVCADCESCACFNCGSVFAKVSEQSTWLCNLCQKKRRLMVTSGAWLHELPKSAQRTKTLHKFLARKKPIARASSFSQYEDWLENKTDDPLSDASSHGDAMTHRPADVRRYSEMTTEMARRATPTSSRRVSAAWRMLQREEAIQDGWDASPKHLGPNTTLSSTDGELHSLGIEGDSISLGSQQDGPMTLMDEQAPASCDNDYELPVVAETATVVLKEDADSMMKSSQRKNPFDTDASDQLEYDESTLTQDTHVATKTEIHSPLQIHSPPVASTSRKNWSRPDNRYDSFNASFIELEEPDVESLDAEIRETYYGTESSPWYDIKRGDPCSTDPVNHSSNKPRDSFHAQSPTEQISRGSASYIDMIHLHSSFGDQTRFPQRRLTLPSTEHDTERHHIKRHSLNVQQSIFPETSYESEHVRERIPDETLSIFRDLSTVDQNSDRRRNSLSVKPMYSWESDSYDDYRHRRSLPTSYRAPSLDYRPSVREKSNPNAPLNQSIQRLDDPTHSYSHYTDTLPTSDGPTDLSIELQKIQTVGYSNNETTMDYENYSKFDVRSHQTLPEREPDERISSDSYSYPSPQSYEQWITDMNQTCNHTKTERSTNPGQDVTSSTLCYTSSQQRDEFTTKIQSLTAEECSLVLHRCPNFENISGLIRRGGGGGGGGGARDSIEEEEEGEEEAEVVATGPVHQYLAARQATQLEALDEDEVEDCMTQEDRPTSRWSRDSKSNVSTTCSSSSSSSIITSPDSQSQFVSAMRQEDEMWTALFSPSESLMESAKEVSAQLDLMSLADEEMDEEYEAFRALATKEQTMNLPSVVGTEDDYCSTLTKPINIDVTCPLLSDTSLTNTQMGVSVLLKVTTTLATPSDSITTASQNRFESTRDESEISYSNRQPSSLSRTQTDSSIVHENLQLEQVQTSQPSTSSTEQQRSYIHQPSTATDSSTHEQTNTEPNKSGELVRSMPDCQQSEQTNNVKQSEGKRVWTDTPNEAYVTGTYWKDEEAADARTALATTPLVTQWEGMERPHALMRVNDRAHELTAASPHRPEVRTTVRSIDAVSSTSHCPSTQQSASPAPTNTTGLALANESTTLASKRVCPTRDQAIERSAIYSTGVPSSIDGQTSNCSTDAPPVGSLSGASLKPSLPSDRHPYVEELLGTNYYNYRSANFGDDSFSTSSSTFQRVGNIQTSNNASDENEKETTRQFNSSHSPHSPSLWPGIAVAQNVSYNQTLGEFRDASQSGGFLYHHPVCSLSTPPIPTDRGLRFARDLLISPRESSNSCYSSPFILFPPPDSVDWTDSPTEIPVLWEEETQSLSPPPSPTQSLRRRGLFPIHATCCTSWIPTCPQPSVDPIPTLANFHSLASNSPITEAPEPLVISTNDFRPVQSLHYQRGAVITSTEPQTSPTDPALRQHINKLECIKEEEAVIPLNIPKEGEEIASTAYPMSSSSSSKGSSYLTVRLRRPRSSSVSNSEYRLPDDYIGLHRSSLTDRYHPPNHHHYHHHQYAPSELSIEPDRARSSWQYDAPSFATQSRHSHRIRDDMDLHGTYKTTGLSNRRHTLYNTRGNQGKLTEPLTDWDRYSSNQDSAGFGFKDRFNTVQDRFTRTADDYMSSSSCQPTDDFRLLSRNKLVSRSIKYTPSPRRPHRMGNGSLRGASDVDYSTGGRRWRLRTNPSSKSSNPPVMDYPTTTDETETGERRSYFSLPLSDSTTRKLCEAYRYPFSRKFTSSLSESPYAASLKRPASIMSGRIRSGRTRSTVSNHLSKSTDYLGPYNHSRSSTDGCGDTSMRTLRARLAAARSESYLNDSIDDGTDIGPELHYPRYGSLDRRLDTDNIVAQQLRRQVEKQHYQLLESLTQDTSPLQSRWASNLSNLNIHSSSLLSTTPIAGIDGLTPPMHLSPGNTIGLPSELTELAGGQQHQQRTLISATLAPPIFSTATVRSGVETVWPTNTGLQLMPMNQPVQRADLTSFAPFQQQQQQQQQPLGSTNQPPHPDFLMDQQSILQNPTDSQPAPSTQTDLTLSLLELLQNPDVVQAIANNPAFAAQLATLIGPQFNLPADTSQMTLAAMAGAMAATAVANAGLINGMEPVYDTSMDEQWASAAQALGLNPTLNPTLGPQDSLDRRDFDHVLPPYAVSNGDSFGLENLMQQIRSALTLENEIGVNEDGQNAGNTEMWSNGADQLDLQWGTNTALSDAQQRQSAAHLDQELQQQHQQQQRQQGDMMDGKRQQTGLSETIDSWLMPGTDSSRLTGDTNVNSGNIQSSLNWSTAPNSNQTNTLSNSTRRNVNTRTYDCPTKRLLLMRDSRVRYNRGTGIGMRIVGGHIRPDGRLGAFVEEIDPRGPIDQLHGEIREGDEILEWNSIPLVGKTFEEVQNIISKVTEETELLVRAREDKRNEQSGQPWSIGQVPPTQQPTEDNGHEGHTIKRVDALCHHHAAQQALIGMQQRQLCPHMQQHFATMPATDSSFLHQSQRSTSPDQPNLGPHSSSTGSESATSTEHNKSIRRQATMNSNSDMGTPRGSNRSIPQSSYSASIHPTSGSTHRTPISKEMSHRRRDDGPEEDYEAEEEEEVDIVVERAFARKSAANVAVARTPASLSPPPPASSSSNRQTSPLRDTVLQRRGSKKSRNSTSHDQPEIFGEIELILTFDDYDQSLTVHVSRGRDLPPMDLNGLADPFVKIRLHPDPTEDPDFNRQTKYMANTLNPEWQQTVVFMNCFKRTLKRRILEVTVWDFDRLKTNDFMGQTQIFLGGKTTLDGRPHWYPLHKLETVVVPSAKKVTSSARSTGPDTSRPLKNQRDINDKRSVSGKNSSKDQTSTHR